MLPSLMIRKVNEFVTKHDVIVNVFVNGQSHVARNPLETV